MVGARSLRLLALAPFAARAAAHELPGGIDATAAVRLAVLYDDNALLGRRGPFLDAGGGRTDVASLQAVELGLGRALAGGRVAASGRFQAARLRTTEELAGHDTAAVAAFERRLGAGPSLAPSFTFAYHDDRPEWSYRSYQPALRARHTFRWGSMAELRWRYTRQDFARTAGGTAPPRQSYANLDARGQVAELELRHWIGRRVRPALTGAAHTSWYAGNTDANLADYAGLDPGQERRDLGGGVTAELLVAPWAPLLVGAGGGYQRNRSSSDAFAYRAAHALASALWQPHRRHAIYAQLDYARFDFPRHRFDRRFADTRVDFRRDLAASYRLDATDALRVEVAVRRLDAVSNDCADFDVRRDALGLPLHSRSYSCYGRGRVEVSARWEI